MGGLLDKPITEKRSSAGESDRMRWSATDMQGWRQDMEDEHIAHADLGEEFANVGLYCVFDGHGGKAVGTPPTSQNTMPSGQTNKHKPSQTKSEDRLSPGPAGRLGCRGGSGGWRSGRLGRSGGRDFAG